MPAGPGESSTATAGMDTLFSGRNEAEDALTGNSLFFISARIAADTVRLTGKAGAWAAFQG